MSSALAVFGAVGGSMVCVAAGVIGTRVVMAAAANDEQRQVLRQVLTLGGLYAAAVMSIILFAAFQVLAGWAYVAALVLWFGPLVPALSWAHQRLDAAVGRVTLGTPLLTI